MSPRQIIFRKKFKTLLCKKRELVLTYDVQANNRTSQPTAFYALYIEPNDGGTGHSVFKLSTKQIIITLRCKPVPMPDNVIEVMNKMGIDEEMPDRIHFSSIHKELTLDDLYGDVESQDDSSCASDKSWDMPKDCGQIDQRTVVYDYAVNDDKIDNLKKEDALHLQNGLTNNNNANNNNNNNIKHGGVINQQDKQQNHFGAANNNLQP